MTKASDNKFPKLILAETTTPLSPAVSHRALWVDANKVLWWKSSAGLDSPLAALNKWDATVAPTANEDSGDGYGVGSRWIDVTANKEYVCLDATLTAAVWTETTQSGGAGSLTGVSIKKETTGTTIGTTSTDIVGATLTIVPTVVETWVVYATWDFTWSVASAGNLGVGDLNFTGTGTMTAPSAALSGDQVVRATVASLGLITGVSAASHTIKLTALKTGAGGTLVTSGVSSLLVVRFAA